MSNDSYLMNLDHFAVCYDEAAKEVAQVRRQCHEITLHIDCVQLVLAAVEVTADGVSHVPLRMYNLTACCCRAMCQIGARGSCRRCRRVPERVNWVPTNTLLSVHWTPPKRVRLAGRRSPGVYMCHAAAFAPGLACVRCLPVCC